MKPFIKQLTDLRACLEAIVWARNYDTEQEAWDACERGDWMLWYLAQQAGPPESESRKELVLIACQCARLALKYLPEGEKRPLDAIETAENWACGVDGVSLQDVRNAAASAADAAVRTNTLKQCADIVRETHPTLVRKATA